jgi:hypothetical protein
MSTALQAVNTYPFNLDGSLCPLLNHAELLAGFYAEESLRHGIKSFCKRTNWPGKPVMAFAVGPEKLQELVLSLFNSPQARATLRRLAEADKATYLDNAIWQWLTVVNPKLAERVSKCCEGIKDRMFIKVEPLQKLLAAIQQEKADTQVVGALAYVVLAFAMLQPNDRYQLGEAFLSTFPEYAKGFGGA